MLKHALNRHTDFIIDTCEVERGGISYSIDTVEYLEKKYDVSDKLGLIIGDDLVDDFHKWKDANILADRVELIVAHRMYGRKRKFEYPHRYLDNLMLPISSSEIRKRIRGGKSVRYFLPDTVWRYICEYQLYSG
jgi:nicotinate-nucleotide adenylyltransferase